MKSKKIRKFSSIKNRLIKITVLLLIIAFNWVGLSNTGSTFAYFNDIENSEGTSFEASTLDFSLNSTTDFTPDVTPTATSTRNVEVINNGILNFEYATYATSTNGSLCNNLNLTVTLRGEEVYNGSLVNFNYNAGQFATTTANNWQFKASLASENADPQNQTCQFDFVFNGTQIGGAGFSDREKISNTINSGEWLKKLVINKVYYNVDEQHGTEDKNEWVELYNPNNQSINLKDWEICDQSDCAKINSNSSIPALGYALISHDASTWNYWEIPNEVEKIHQLGGQFSLNNDDDMLILKDATGSIFDQMNWGIPTSTWPNYNSNLWNPGATTTPEGHMLGRVPNGYDSDQVSDWKDLGLPNVTVTYPNGGETWWVGRTYPIQWIALNPNGPDSELSINLYYSKDSGATWANIIKGEANDGRYDWRVPLCLDNGHGGCYYTASSKARIKVVANGPENFMVYDWDMSDSDFCPPIDYDLLTPEEKAILEQMNIESNLVDAEETVALLPPPDNPLTEIQENAAENVIPEESITKELFTEKATTTEEILEEKENTPVDNPETQNNNGEQISEEPAPTENEVQNVNAEEQKTEEEMEIELDESTDDNTNDNSSNQNNEDSVNINENLNPENIVTDLIQVSLISISE